MGSDMMDMSGGASGGTTGLTGNAMGMNSSGDSGKVITKFTKELRRKIDDSQRKI